MELVYLWIEGYKNIKKEGFNFSPRFDVKYDEKENEITIDKKKDYTSIFPSNINVTAIVGENGSGKSGVAECISFNLFSTLHNDKAIIFIYHKDKEFYKYCIGKIVSIISPLRCKSVIVSYDKINEAIKLAVIPKINPIIWLFKKLFILKLV